MSIKALIPLVMIGMLVAPAAAYAQEEVIYFHTDAIGSVRATTNASGAVQGRYDYLPFGELWPSVPPPPVEVRQFAGKERDKVGDHDLDYFGARYHFPVTGRFTTVDPVLNIEQALIDPQQWNRYAYARDNPFRHVDPDGRAIESIWDAFNIGLGFTSLVGNLRQGSYGAAIVDAIGVAIDAGAAAVPVLPGGASSAIRAFRGLDRVGDIASSGRRLLPFDDVDRINEVNKTLDRIESGRPFKHAQDGTTFRNREGKLPGHKDPDYYREYTVETPGSRDRGARRIVRGTGGETYYTDDHYKNFIQIDPKKYPEGYR